MHIVPTMRGCMPHSSQPSTCPWSTPSLWMKDLPKSSAGDKDGHNVPCMCVWTEISKRRFPCRTTSTKYTSGRAGSLPVPCAAPTTVWMLEAVVVNKFWLSATDLLQNIKPQHLKTIVNGIYTSHRSIWTGDFCRWEWDPQWTTFFTIEAMVTFGMEWERKWEKVELISGSVSSPREQHAATSPFAVGNLCCLGVYINWFWNQVKIHHCFFLTFSVRIIHWQLLENQLFHRYDLPYPSCLIALGFYHRLPAVVGDAEDGLKPAT